MVGGTLALLEHQLRVAWGLAEATLDGLSDEEALWCSSSESWTVRLGDDGRWHADWTEPEPWPAPPTSIAWIQWHVIWWWSTVADHSFGDGSLRRKDVTWPGAEAASAEMRRLRDTWLGHLRSLDEADLDASDLTRWPYTDDRPFGQVAGWVNIELMKNVAEMALLRRASPLYERGRFT